MTTVTVTAPLAMVTLAVLPAALDHPRDGDDGRPGSPTSVPGADSSPN